MLYFAACCVAVLDGGEMGDSVTQSEVDMTSPESNTVIRNETRVVIVIFSGSD